MHHKRSSRHLAARRLPPPDPATWVDLDRPSDGVAGRAHLWRGSGGLIASAGLGAIIVSGASAFVDVLDLPGWSQISIAALGGGLVAAGAMTRRRGPVPAPPALASDPPSVQPDLPTLTAEISEVLSRLRHEHGLAYRTHTWVEDVLPMYDATLRDGLLTRDLLAVAALDAGGLRADVSALTATHSHTEIVAAASALLGALLGVLRTCEAGAERAFELRPSDPSDWAVPA